MRGRKPDPSRAITRTGHRPIPEPIDLSPGVPVEPTNLTDLGLEMWREVSAAYEVRGMSDTLDRFALFAMCRLWEALHAGQGGLGTFKEFRGYCSDFGMNPVARLRLGGMKKKPGLSTAEGVQSGHDVRSKLVAFAGGKTG